LQKPRPFAGRILRPLLAYVEAYANLVQ
jgi:hypothetical protein